MQVLVFNGEVIVDLEVLEKPLDLILYLLKSLTFLDLLFFRFFFLYRAALGLFFLYRAALGLQNLALGCLANVEVVLRILIQLFFVLGAGCALFTVSLVPLDFLMV